MLDAAMRWLGYGLCHQLPARSFFGAGHQLPVCARDTGMYVGFVISLVVIAVLERGRRRTGMPPVWVVGAAVVLFGAMAWDGITSYAGLRETTNVIRLATGAGAGFALSLVVAPILNAQAWRAPSSGRVLGDAFEGVIWLLSVPAVIALTWWGGPLLGVLYPVAVALCVLATFTAVNLVMVTLVPRFERRATRLRDLAPAAGIALLVTVGELAAADLVRVALLTLVGRG